MRFVKRTIAKAENAAKISEKYGISSFVSGILASRGFDEISAEEYLYPSEDFLISPFEFDAMEEVLSRIDEAISSGEQIAIYSDYDTDGICAAAIMYKLLKRLDCEPIMYVPNRFTEGYGTNAKAIAELCSEASLIISVDCGIRSVEDVKTCREMGVDFIIADHHECGILPDTPYILDPKRPGENYPYKNLCGAAIAFKIAYGMLEEEALDLIDIAAVATIADMVPLTGENRVIAALGIEKLRKNPQKGFKYLMQAAGINQKTVNSMQIGYGISPRINAASRLSSARTALNMLISENEGEAAQCAAALCELNAKRQELQKEISEKCVTEALKLNISDCNIIMLKSEDYDEGIVGLCASAIKERFNRPAVIFKIKDGILTGSARGVEGIDIYKVLNSCADLFLKFGGHKQAAGLTLKEENFDVLFKRANEYIENNYTKDVFIKTEIYDECIDPKSITLDDVKELELLEPCGEANEKPRFLVSDAELTAVRRMGADGRHAKMRINDSLNLIYFSAPEIKDGAHADIVGELEINEYNSTKSIQLRACVFNRRDFNESEFNKGFQKDLIRQIVCLYEIISNKDNYKIYKSAQEWIAELKADLNTPVGTCVLIGSAPGLSAFKSVKDLNLPVYSKALLQYNGENAAIVLPNTNEVFGIYNNIYCCGDMISAYGCKNAKILINAGLYNTYLSFARSCFVAKEEYSAYLRAFSKAGGAATVSELINNSISACELNVAFNKMWYVFNVFAEQKLIEIKKSDKIFIKINDRVQKRSITEAAFESLLK